MGCGQGSLPPNPTPPTVGGQHPAPHRRGRLSGLLQKTLPVNWTHKYPLFLGQCGKNRPGTRRERTSDTLLCPDQEAGHPTDARVLSSAILESGKHAKCFPRSVWVFPKPRRSTQLLEAFAFGISRSPSQSFGFVSLFSFRFLLF